MRFLSPSQKLLFFYGFYHLSNFYTGCDADVTFFKAADNDIWYNVSLHILVSESSLS
jgi:hypothetical protein